VTLADYRGEGSLFGVSAIVSRENSPLTVETLEDTFCFLLDNDRFLEFVARNPLFLDNYLRCFSQDMICLAYSELHSISIRERVAHGVRLANVKAGDAVRREVATVDMGEPLHKVAELMTALDTTGVMVRGSDGSIVGLVVDSDFRAKVVARLLDYNQPVATIMTSDLPVISPESSCLDALIQMTNDNVSHLLVQRGREITGVVSINDIMMHRGISPVTLLREIDTQSDIQGLYRLSGQLPRLVQELVDGGATSTSITRIVSVLNDRIVGRLLLLMEGKIGPAPVPFCWIVMGSEGRQEQTLRTDQDNAILYDDIEDDWEVIKTAKLYFRTLGNEMIEHLVKCGYPLCKGGMMASRATWRKPFSVWTSYFNEWMTSADPESMLLVKVFLDFRHNYGAAHLAGRLREHVFEEGRRRRFFSTLLAKDAAAIAPPLSFFRNFIVERDGQHKNRLDLKLRGIVPIVDFSRAMAFKSGILETNTMSRLARLREGAFVPEDLCSEIMEAYEFLMHLRLLHQLRLVNQQVEPHNFVDPAALSDLEKHTLKGAFGVINGMQAYLAKHRVGL
jgi:CBS domain-containing protein